MRFSIKTAMFQQLAHFFDIFKKKYYTLEEIHFDMNLL